MRPSLQLLSDDLRDRIVSEAFDVLSRVGVSVLDEAAVSLLSDHGARVGAGDGRVRLPAALLEVALASAPGSFSLYDATGEPTHDFSPGKVHFTPGSAALTILDHDTGTARTPDTADYVAYAKLVSRMGDLASQSTALIPGDVHEGISDAYRLFLSLLYCSKPVVTGTFRAESFRVMKDFQVAVRGTESALADKPLTIFTCCPTSPLSWSHEALGPLLECARHGIPVEVVPMPLAGFMAPVTQVGTLVQHTAEALSGVAIHQLANPGAPLLYGTSTAIFDVRFGTTPMGAVETMMLGCAVAEIGRSLGLPTQAYIALSDAKLLDAQAGLETGVGATLAALAGINNCSGPGMLDFESCHSLEKLVLDHEICGMAFRLVQGVRPRGDFPVVDRMDELLAEGHLLISDHSRRHLAEEQRLPGTVIDRMPRPRWIEDGESTLGARAHARVAELLAGYRPWDLPHDVEKELVALMEAAALRVGQQRLPERPR